ncbi:MAG: hypothetical protein MUP21_07770 [Dehalococcoidia bacterium]|jgi:hypothetical protein|nr:hypothetical protein [Dehalococcoidia bacterium]
MDAEQIILGVINIIGGILVIGSYYLSARARPDRVKEAWGNVPESIKPMYIVSMLTAAAGYFAFSYFIIFRLDPVEVAATNSFSYPMFILAYALILFPSAMWMPLTFAMLEKPSRLLWWAIRVTLFTVGIGSLGLLALLLILNHDEPTWLLWLAVAGAILFSIQTAFLDALLWPIYFPVKNSR